MFQTSRDLGTLAAGSNSEVTRILPHNLNPERHSLYLSRASLAVGGIDDAVVRTQLYRHLPVWEDAREPWTRKPTSIVPWTLGMSGCSGFSERRVTKPATSKWNPNALTAPLRGNHSAIVNHSFDILLALNLSPKTPSRQIIPTLGSKVYKWYLLLAIWSVRGIAHSRGQSTALQHPAKLSSKLRQRSQRRTTKKPFKSP